LQFDPEFVAAFLEIRDRVVEEMKAGRGVPLSLEDLCSQP
jgi:hypothetical protein